MAFTNVKKTEKKIRVMQLVNTSDAPVKVEFAGLPAHLNLKPILKLLSQVRKVWWKEPMMPQKMQAGEM